MALILPEQEQPEAQPTHPTGPAISFTVEAQITTLSIAHGNGLFTQLVLTTETMQQLWKVWKESRKELTRQQQIVAEVIRTKR